MHIEIDDKSGFCSGVVRAISMAEQALSNGGKVCSLGDIVHNRLEVQRLERLGLRTVSYDDISLLNGGDRLLIRAHGEPPSTYTLARECGVEIIDATCPVVAKLQKRVKSAHERMRQCNGQVVILGKRGHAEVVGLTGQVETPTIVIESGDDLNAIDFSRPIYFLSQTTQSDKLFMELLEQMRRRLSGDDMLEADCTICKLVSSREQHLREFAMRHDVIVFVCGKKSSNGKVLFEICKNANHRSYNIEDDGELQADWFVNAQNVGICGATSTPMWLMHQVAESINALCE